MTRTLAQLQQALVDTEAWLDTLDPEAIASPDSDASDLGQIGSCMAEVAAAELRLAECVAAARGRGRTWTQIGTVLGVSKQAARERFGEPAARS